MTLFAIVQLLASASLVDTHHGDTDGPGRFADTEAEVAVVGVDVPALLKCLDDLDDGLQQGVVKVIFFKFSIELGSHRLAVRAVGSSK